MSKFQVYRGKEQNILSKDAVNGGVWFALDSQKIYYSDGEDFIPMGGSSSVYYGNMTFGVEVSEFNFKPENLDGKSQNPQVDDLILNKDGCFYRVIEVVEEDGEKIFKTTRLTLAGGGSGGPQAGTAAVEYIEPASGFDQVAVLAGKECILKFNVVSKDSAGDPTRNGRVNWKVNGVLVASNEVAYLGLNEFDIGPYLGKSGIQDIVGEFYLDVGTDIPTTIKKSWQANVVNIKFSWDYDFTQVIKDENFAFTTTVTGISTSKTIHVRFDNMPEYTESFTDSRKTLQFNRNEYNLRHGVHTVAMWVSANVGGAEFITDKIVKEIMFIDTNESNALIAFGIQSQTILQYSSLQIPFVVYNPSGNTKINLEDNGVLVDERYEIVNGEKQFWVFTPLTSGKHNLVITGSNGAEASLPIIVEELSLENEEVPDWAFRFKANEYLSNEKLLEDEHFEFSDNFDWNNGGIRQETYDTDKVRQYLRIKAGSQMKIKHKLFEKYNSSKGKSFKFIFKVTKCCDYEAEAISCMTIENSRQIGVSIKANEAIYSSTGTTINAPYCEDTYMELEFDIWPNISNNEQKYVVIWLDGVPCGAAIYNADIFTQSNPVDITIGSEDCDVQLYMFKSYDFHLTDEQHLQNFIADAPNPMEMIVRFNRNNILDENGEISPIKLAIANPDCWVHTYEIDRMTTSKKDAVENCGYAMYRGSKEPYLQADNVSIKVQGTSSASYGAAAFNIDSEFKSGFIDNAGNKSSLFALSENAVPQNYFNTKVNVASCEQANNALNAEWYNRYQPYKCRYRSKNSKARDTMEFHPGVMFLLDKNPKNDDADYLNNNVFKDTEGYIQDPYYKLYSVCNFGNSKKNYTTFHDTSNPKECCIEITDNQDDLQKMLNANYEDSELNDERFDLRYPSYSKSSEETISDIAANWRRLVTWMANSNPKAATNEPLGKTVKFEPYSFKKIISYADGNGSFESTMGGCDPIETYKGEYTHDTYEYRMAKMLSECEDYLIMDSFIYHFLFIERHSMIDNVAKNTFWSTEDGVHWSLVKDYDNDTADGNDNSGNLTIPYGMEAMDKIGSADVFNAKDAVWFNFIDGLYEARRYLYKQLSEAWRAAPYLQAFEEWQNAIPERCWIESYYRQYFRPYEAYGETKYINMLKGGKKTHQRRWFETYQEIYFDSKYGNGNSSKSIYIRANGKNEVWKTETRTLNMYSDCYISIEIGQRLFEQRAKKGENKITFETMDLTGDLNDATVYFFFPETYSAISDISTFDPKIVELNGAKRLQSFSIGAQGKIENLPEISFKENELLRELTVQQCTGIKGSLDLSNLSYLYRVDTTGSTFTGITLPDNAPLEDAILNDINTLTASNLYELQTLIMPEENGNYNKLSSLYVDNIDNTAYINTKDIINKTPNLMYYMLKNVNWVIDSPEEISNDSIEILEFLKTKQPIVLDNAGAPQFADPYQALTGTLTITVNATNGRQDIDPVELYEKYTSDDYFKNLDIIFEDPAMKLYTVTIYSGNNDIAWRKKVKAGVALDAEFLSSGPNGAFTPSMATKPQTAEYTYTFKNWIIKDGEDNILKTSYEEYPLYPAINTDIVIIPEFNAQKRIYKLVFKQGELKDYTVDAYYNDSIFNKIPNDRLPYKDSSLLDFERVYQFVGYAYTENAVEEIDLTEAKVSGNTTLYPVFRNVSVYDNIIDSKFFEVKEYTYKYNDASDPVVGCQIKPNTRLYGKITLPKTCNVDGKELDVISIGQFNTGVREPEFTGTDYGWNITHIFLPPEDNQLREIGAYAFGADDEKNNRSRNLEYFDFKNATNLEVIRDSAFRMVKNLKDVHTFNDGLKRIEYAAFWAAFYNNSGLTINPKITLLGAASFANNHENSVTFINIGIDNTEDGKSQLSVSNSIEIDKAHFGSNKKDSWPVFFDYPYVINFYTNLKYLESSYIETSVDEMTVGDFIGARGTVNYL